MFFQDWYSLLWRTAAAVFHNDFSRGAMRAEPVTEGELIGAVREAGVSSMADVSPVVIETAGTITVIPRASTSDNARSILHSVIGPEESTDLAIRPP